MIDNQLVFAIYVNAFKQQEIQPLVERVVAFLDRHSVSSLIEPDELTNVDLVISMGGDGTFLKAACMVGEREIPILGINKGRLGFLADVLPSEIEDVLEHVLRRDYMIENHTVIKLEADGECVDCYRCFEARHGLDD